MEVQKIAKLKNIRKCFLNNKRQVINKPGNSENRQLNKTLTVIIDQHGEGELIGVFDDEEIIKKLKQKVANKDKGFYIKFYNVLLNEIVKEDILY